MIYISGEVDAAFSCTLLFVAPGAAMQRLLFDLRRVKRAISDNGIFECCCLCDGCFHKMSDLTKKSTLVILGI